MKRKIFVSLILPTYNESESILILLRRIKKVFKKLVNQYFFEIIIVDDNSTDNTAGIIKKAYGKNKLIRVYVRKYIKGLGTAIGYGIEKARGDIIIGMDADGNHPPEAIQEMLKCLSFNNLVVGSRFVKDGGGDDKTRSVLSFLFNLVLKIGLGFPILDNTSGFYAIKKADLIKLEPKKIYFGYGDYHLRLVYFAKKNQFKIKEIPIYYKRRFGGESKSKLLEMMINYLLISVKLSLNL